MEIFESAIYGLTNDTALSYYETHYARKLAVQTSSLLWN